MIAPIGAAHAPRLCAYDPFVGVIGALLRGRGYIVQIVHAFFDESGSQAASAVVCVAGAWLVRGWCVAGYAFEKREARLSAKEWAAVLRQHKLRYFHMVACAGGNGKFAHLAKSQRIKVATSLIGAVKRRAAHGFAVSVDLAAYGEAMSPWGPTALMRSALGASWTKRWAVYAYLDLIAPDRQSLARSSFGCRGLPEAILRNVPSNSSWVPSWVPSAPTSRAISMKRLNCSGKRLNCSGSSGGGEGLRGICLSHPSLKGSRNRRGSLRIAQETSAMPFALARLSDASELR